MGLSNSHQLFNNPEEDQVTIITVEESDQPQAHSPKVTQLKTDALEFADQAGEVMALAALVRNVDPPNHVQADELHEKYELLIGKAKKKYTEYILAVLHHPELDVYELLRQANDSIAEGDKLMTKKRKSPRDVYKARELYKDASDKYWRIRREMNDFLRKVKEFSRNELGLKKEELEEELEEKRTPKYDEVMRKLEVVETRLKQSVKMMDDFKERQMKPITFSVVIVIILIIVFTTYFFV